MAAVRAPIHSAPTCYFAAGASQAEAKLAREEKKKAAEAVSALLEGVIVQPKLKPGQDPKSVLCEFFRHGKCKKGENCRYSHDWGVEVVRKGPKIDLFTDQRCAARQRRRRRR